MFDDGTVFNSTAVKILWHLMLERDPLTDVFTISLSGFAKF